MKTKEYVFRLFEEMYANQYNQKHLLGMLHYVEERHIDFPNYISIALSSTLKFYIKWNTDNELNIKEVIDSLD